jgi:site-specific DNA recombinase
MRQDSTESGVRLAAVYARVSTADQKDHGYSLPSQIEACQELAHREGYTVPADYVFAEDYTGTSLNRPQLRTLRELVQAHRIQAACVYDPDRLARKLALQLLLDEELAQAGVRLLFVSQTFDENPEGKMFFNMRGVFAEYERAKILARTESGRRQRAKAGFVNGGKRTLGYDYVKHGDKGAHYVIHPDEAALVQRIFRLYVQEGLSLYAIACQLTREGIPTPGDRGISGPKRTLAPTLWQPGSVLCILTNETYLGTMYYGKTERLPGLANPDKKTRWRFRPKEEWTAIPVPPIIDQATFDAAQVQRQRNAQRSKRNRKMAYLLCDQRLRCGQCGRIMSGQFNGPRSWRFYRCNGRRSLPNHPCKGKVSAAKIEQQVWEAVERVLNDPAIIEAELARRKAGIGTQQSELARDRSRFESQLAQCDKEQRKWEEAYVNDAIDVLDLKAKKAEIAARRHSAAQELARLADEAQALAHLEQEAISLRRYCQQVRAKLTRLTDEEKRVALDALNIVVYWAPDKLLEITGSIPVCITSNASR